MIQKLEADGAVTAQKEGALPQGGRDYLERERNARARRIAEHDRFAPERDRWRARNAAYYEAIERLVKFAVPKGSRVLEVGCGTGELLAALEPSDGLGVDISSGMIAQARAKHPQLRFAVADAETLDAPELAGREFDYIVLSDVVGALQDVWAAFRAVRRLCSPRTRVVVTYYNFLWEPVLAVAEKLGLKMPIEQQNWLGMKDLENLLELNHFDIIRRGTAQLLPARVPGVAHLANHYLASMPVVRGLALTQFFVCRPASMLPRPACEYSVSVVVPCKNERGNIADIVTRVPEMGSSTEILFVDGNSTDGTVEEIERHLSRRPGTRLIHQGAGKGKGDAVRKGFAAATGDILMILDADLTVPPEELPKFYLAIAEGKGEFINGSRLVYPMEGAAMRFLNAMGNKAFGVILSNIIEQSLKDTLCGTKVLFRRDYERIAANRAFFGDFDPFGDFDLLFGAAKANLKIVELPVRYRARTYGDTKIHRFRHGALLAKMSTYAYSRFRSAY